MDKADYQLNKTFSWKIRNYLKLMLERGFQKSVFLKNSVSFCIVPLTVVYMEILSKIKIFGDIFDKKLVYLLVLSVAMGFLIGAWPMLLPGKHRRRVLVCLLIILAVLFSFHSIYYNNFHTFFSWNNIGEAGGATHFWREAFLSAVGVWYMLAAFFAPVVLWGVFGKKLISDESKGSISLTVAGIAVFLCLYIPCLIIINRSQNKGEETTPYYYYTYIQNDIDQTYRYYGILNTTRIDLKQLIFGKPVEKIDLSDLFGLNFNIKGDPDEYGWNTMEIDFDNLKNKKQYSNFDQFYSSVAPTRKNQYTGIFKGKNLVFLTLESFCGHVIDPELTPLLYQMSTQGFIFNNFYNPMWGGSTASGEYAIMTGNFNPNTNCLNLSAKTYQPFALGNQFSKIGYQTLAYHNYNGYFYNRDASHPNFGYAFKGVGSGLKLKNQLWPNSDKEMADATVGEYANLDGPFHVYYMTMSGHLKYNFRTNQMSIRHKDDLPEKFKSLDTEVQAYLACQYEVELMLQKIVSELDKSGKLQDTVFAMSADHYPYGMSDEGLASLYGLKITDIRFNMELYKNVFILWSPLMTEPITVDVPCSTVDILPTISNMFGLEYDSRLMMGSDIMSDCEHFAPIKMMGWCWMSQEGKYLAFSDQFIPSETCTLSEKQQKAYVKRMSKMISSKAKYSNYILGSDYYRHIFT